MPRGRTVPVRGLAVAAPERLDVSRSAHMSPQFRAYTADLQNRLIGRWETNNVGGHMETTLTLQPDGTGVLEIENPVCCDRYQIQWSLDSDEHISLAGSGAVFRTEDCRFQVGSLRYLSGEAKEVLRIFDDDPGEPPWEFFRLPFGNESSEDENG